MAMYDIAQSPQYLNSVLNNEYIIQEGVFILPVAEEPPTTVEELANWSPVAIVRAHAPYRIRKLNFNYKKQNTPPVIPAPTSTGLFQFVNGSITFGNPNPNLGLYGYDWTVAGLYVYVENCRSSNDDGFVLGNHPYLTITQADNANKLTPSSVQLGAISQAGTDAQRGYTQGQLISSEGFWLYNTTSYFPYTLLNDEVANGSNVNAADAPPIYDSLVATGEIFENEPDPTTTGDNLPEEEVDPFGNDSPF